MILITVAKSNVNKHAAVIHEANKAFKCITCKAYFSKKSILNQHMTLVHEGKKPFKKKDNLNKHIASVHSISSH